MGETNALERADEHILRELGSITVRGDDGELRMSAPVVPEMWIPGTDVVRASVLFIWADQLTGLHAVDVMTPRVPVTLQLDLHLYEPPAGIERIHGVSHLVKAGSAVVGSSAVFTDQDGRPLGSASGLFMTAPNPNLLMPEGVDPFDVVAQAGGPLGAPFAERVGCRRVSPGVAELGRSEDGLNASNTVNGGLLALLVEEAALSLQPGATLSTIAMRYLRPVRLGPAVATAEVHGSVAEVAVHDHGREEHSLAVVATTRTFPADT